MNGEQFVSISIHAVDRFHDLFPLLGSQQIEPSATLADKLYLAFTQNEVVHFLLGSKLHGRRSLQAGTCANFGHQIQGFLPFAESGLGFSL